MAETEETYVGQVELDALRHIEVCFRVGDTDIAATLPPHHDEHEEPFVVGVEDFIDEAGDRSRRYLKIPRKLRSATHTVVEYYDSHENLKKGAKAATVVAGALAVGSLVIMGYKRRH